MFEQIFQQQQSQYYPAELIIINIVFAFLVSLVVVYSYVKTHRGSSYSQSFVQTLIFLCVLSCVMMMVIGNSLARAFGLVGALSIIRFRTVLKDTRDMAFVFFALAMGMAVGTNSHRIAIIGTIFMACIIVIVHVLNIGRRLTEHYLLNMRFRPNVYDEHALTVFFKKYLKSHTLLNLSSIKPNELSETIYEIKMKDKKKDREFIEKVRAIPGVETARLITSTEHWD